MPRIKLPAKIEHLQKWMQFVSEHARTHGFTEKRIAEIELALEEALVNVCHYAYPESVGHVEVRCHLSDNIRFVIEILDRGLPFNMLSLSTPNLTDDLSSREIGGLGVLLIRKMMDEVHYNHEDGNNILHLVAYQREQT